MPPHPIDAQDFPPALTRRKLLVAAAGLLAAAGCRRRESAKAAAARAAGKLPQEIYVWQRVWTPAVAQAVAQAQQRVDGLSVLAAEVEWNGREPRIIRPKLDLAALGKSGCPAGLAVRIGPWSGPFEAESPVTRKLSGWIVETLAAAQRGGWSPGEVQIDFDVATSKLSGYQTWLRVFRQAVAPLPVSFTVLPDWLNSPILRAMAQECGRYVLQVHAVERARAAADVHHLIDAAAARRWVESAGALGVPFRVALPTYRSAVGFDAAGKIIGIDSEGPARAWPQGTKVVTYTSPAAEIAGLVAGWTADRPSAFEGILWYRLPVAGESRNWTWKTLEPVMAGRAPLENLGVSCEGSNPFDVFLTNSGEAEMPWPEAVTARIESGAITAADALGGYAMELDPAASRRAIFRRNSAESLHFLPPGGKKPLGWLRTLSTTNAHEIILSIP